MLEDTAQGVRNNDFRLHAKLAIGWPYLGVFLVAVAVCTAHHVFEPGIKTALQFDGRHYFESCQRITALVLSLLTGKVATIQAAEQALRPWILYDGPILPVVFGLPFVLFGHVPASADWSLLLFWQTVFQSICAVLIFALVKSLTGSSKTSFLAALAWILYPPAIIASGRFMTETLASCLLLSLPLSCHWARTSRAGGFVSGLVAAALILLKPGMIPSVVLTTAVVLGFDKKRVVLAMTMAIGLAVGLSPWLAYTKFATGKPTLLVQRSPVHNTLIGWDPETGGWQTSPASGFEQVMGSNVMSSGSEPLPVLAGIWRSHPWESLRILGEKPGHLYLVPWNDYRATVWGINANAQQIIHLCYLSMILFGSACLIISRRRQSVPEAMLPILCLAAPAGQLVYLMFEPVCRYASAQGAGPVTPTFYARQDYVGLFTQWAVAGDTNGDGIPDLIAVEEGEVLVMFGNGDGTFRAGPGYQETAVGSGAQTLTVDLNGDGKLDLIIAGAGTSNSSPGGFAACLGNGDGTFQTGTFYPAGNDNSALMGVVVTGDFNGDGLTDVAQVGPSGVWLFAGKGDGTFNTGTVVSPLESGGIGMAAVDLNLDGKLDLVVAISYAGSEEDQGDGFFVLFGNGNGTFQSPQHYTQPNRPYVVAAGPLGGKGEPGIVLSLVGEPYVAVFFGNGSGELSGPNYVPLQVHDAGLAVGDVNGDGIPDIIAASSEAYVAFGTASNSFQKEEALPVQAGDGIYNLTLADLRNDGRIDIVTDSQFGVSVLLNAGKGKFEDGLFTKLPAAAGCGVTGDFNGDGKQDIAVNTSQGISILLGTGKPSALLTVGQALALPGAGCLTQARDLNGDGILDLVITSPTEVEAYLGNGDGTFTLKSSTPILNAPEYVVLADFNHDGKLDFATDGNQLALGNGDGTFQTPAAFVPNPPTQGFNNIAVGDINNDGWPDIVLTNFDIPYTDVYIGLNNHQGGFIQVPTNYGENSSAAYPGGP